MNIADNIFLSGNVAPWFSYIVVKPHGVGHFLNGVNISGNRFRSINGPIDRAERVDTSFADLDFSKFRQVNVEGNTFHAITTPVANPLRIRHTESTASQTWDVTTGGRLPFGAHARFVDSVVALGEISSTSNTAVFTTPYVDAEQGPNGDEIKLNWSQAVKGKVAVSVRIDG